MRILVESADIETIAWATGARLVNGVFVSPRTLDSDAFGQSPAARVEAIARTTTAPVVVPVAAVALEDLENQARGLAALGDHVMVALPFIDDGVTVIGRLIGAGHRVAAQYVCTVAQAVLAARIGASCAVLSAATLAAAGESARELVERTRRVFDRHDLECELLVADLDAPDLAVGCLASGADGIAVTATTLRAMLHHPLTDSAVDRMLGDASRRRPRTRRR